MQKLFTLPVLGTACALAIVATLLLDSRYHSRLEELFEPLVLMQESRVQTIYVGQKDGYTVLKSGGIFINYNVYNPEHPYRHYLEYTALLSLSAAYVEDPREILVIGLAGGTVPRYLHRHYPQAAITCVDFDEAIPGVAERYFDFHQDDRMRVVVDDGRVFLQQNHTNYDLIILDAFDGANVPFHLYTVEFLSLAKSRLRSGGFFAANTPGAEQVAARFRATFRQVFGHVDSFQGEQSGNIILVAPEDGSHLPQEELLAMMRLRQQEIGFEDLDMAELFSATYLEKPGDDSNVPVFTDDFAPVNLLLPPPRPAL